MTFTTTNPHKKIKLYPEKAESNVEQVFFHIDSDIHVPRDVMNVVIDLKRIKENED
jgi:hypothetical protein